MGDVYLNISKNEKKINKKVKHISVHVMVTRFSNKIYLFNMY